MDAPVADRRRDPRQSRRTRPGRCRNGRFRRRQPPTPATATGRLSAQLTFRVGLSHWNRFSCSLTFGGRCCSPTRSRYSSGAETSATIAFFAVIVVPSAVRTPVARPPVTSTSVTLAPVRTCPPRDSNRRCRAKARFCAPPCGTGKPTSCPSMDNNQPKIPLPAASGGTSACMALPVSSSGPPSPVKVSTPNRRTGNTANRARSRMPDNRLRPSNPNAALIGGIEVNMASSNGSRMRCQPSNISNQACPSPTPNSSRPVAVSVGSR